MLSFNDSRRSLFVDRSTLQEIMIVVLIEHVDIRHGEISPAQEIRGKCTVDQRSGQDLIGYIDQALMKIF